MGKYRKGNNGSKGGLVKKGGKGSKGKGKKKGTQSESIQTKISKKLSYHLRHDMGLTRDDMGFHSLDELLPVLQQSEKYVDLAFLQELVKEDGKERYKL